MNEKDFIVHTLTGAKVDYNVKGIEGANVKEKLQNVLEKLLDRDIDISNIQSIYYNGVAYIV
jgi:hypothetical protein